VTSLAREIAEDFGPKRPSRTKRINRATGQRVKRSY
jgi:hypothetical protein